MPEEGTVIAFFDLDHTLVDGSTGSLYARVMVRDGYMEPRGMFWVTWYTLLYKMNKLPRAEVYRRVLAIMGRHHVLEMIRMMDLGFEQVILPRIYLGGFRQVQMHGEMGHHTVVATAAGEYIAERVRTQLGADGVIATPIPVDGDHITEKMQGPTAFMEGKLEMAREYCARLGADLADCYFYSDSASDLPLLSAVGHPVLVNPQLRLKAAVRGRGWPELRFREYAVFDEVRRPGTLMTEDMERFSTIYEESLR